MGMKEQTTQEEAAARDMMEAEYDQLAELVTALQANPGDDRAFEKFYELTYPRILYTSRSLVNSEQSALDATVKSPPHCCSGTSTILPSTADSSRKIS